VTENHHYEGCTCTFNRSHLRLYLFCQCRAVFGSVTLSLPDERRIEKAENGAETAKNFDWCAMRALIVDDEIEICMMVAKHLQNLGFETQYALTVKEAKLKLLGSSYDIMFMDLNLTDGSGFDIIHHRNHMKLKTKIVVISAYDSESSKTTEAGADLFLPKPFAIRRINEALDTLNLLPKNLIA
jgi:CheY-like chemotaxis protein